MFFTRYYTHKNAYAFINILKIYVCGCFYLIFFISEDKMNDYNRGVCGT